MTVVKSKDLEANTSVSQYITLNVYVTASLCCLSVVWEFNPLVIVKCRRETVTWPPSNPISFHASFGYQSFQIDNILNRICGFPQPLRSIHRARMPYLRPIRSIYRARLSYLRPKTKFPGCKHQISLVRYGADYFTMAI
jgi:hypothetical protein